MAVGINLHNVSQLLELRVLTLRILWTIGDEDGAAIVAKNIIPVSNKDSVETVQPAFGSLKRPVEAAAEEDSEKCESARKRQASLLDPESAARGMEWKDNEILHRLVDVLFWLQIVEVRWGPGQTKLHDSITNEVIRSLERLDAQPQPQPLIKAAPRPSVPPPIIISVQSSVVQNVAPAVNHFPSPGTTRPLPLCPQTVMVSRHSLPPIFIRPSTGIVPTGGPATANQFR
ncbi:uncharacterized protein LOC129589104 [Paramacrobiotus metropolitanus]|uniref:uncharacterized protein LOC129589104 n=1 Tax=Paramacrobiotus metropolitanus TaxID=2943436 RepID=UPI0024465003|nr:uncharacterized protein LOC129589104 [Paramacrobiotus metropolitanus]